MVFKFWKLLFLSVVTIILTACGGGGGNSEDLDTIAPVITLNGASTVYIKKGETYHDLGAVAVDNVDGNVDVEVRNVDKVNSYREGNYTILYAAKDHANNYASVNRVVTVIEDNEKPEITVNTPDSIKELSSFTPVATAKDNIDGEIDVTIDSSEVDTSVPGRYRVIYSAIDSSGNEARKEVDVTVTAFSITELFEKSKELKDVSYVVVGDSTRYYEGTNNVLINSRDSDNGYYKDVLSLKEIKFMHTAIEGQTVYSWLRGKKELRKGGQSFTIDDTLEKIAQVNPNHCIVEFSMGINDDIRDYDDHEMFANLKSNITESMNRLKETYPNVKIVLVSPVPYDEYSSVYHSSQLNCYYEALKDELHLPFVSGYDILRGGYPDNTLDNLHPKEYASKELVDAIFEQIENGSIYP